MSEPERCACVLPGEERFAWVLPFDERLFPLPGAARFELAAAAPLPRPDPFFPLLPFRDAVDLLGELFAEAVLLLVDELLADDARLLVEELFAGDALPLVEELFAEDALPLGEELFAEEALPLVEEPFEPLLDRALLDRPLLDPPLLDRPLPADVPRPLLDVDSGADASERASARRRACAPLATRSPEAFPLLNFRAAVARLTVAASLAAALALRGLLAMVAIG